MMKYINLPIGLLIVGFAATSHAQPGVEASPKASTTNGYVAMGVAMGGDKFTVASESADDFYVNPSLEVGHRLLGSLWAHGEIAGGTTLGLQDNHEGGQRLVVRGGLEERVCVSAWACVIAGADVGYRHERLDAMATQQMIYNVDDVAAFEHLGLELGTRSLRFRPTIENTSSSQGLHAGSAVTGSLAYVW